MPTLRQMLNEDTFVRAVGVHDGMSAILAEQAGFEAVWAGGLGISTAHGVPDAGLLTMTEMLDVSIGIKHSTSLPVIVDVDSGYGDTNVIRRMVRINATAGIDALCIEDKQYPKRNSFRSGNVLEDPAVFSRKIEAATSVPDIGELMIVARLESFIAGETIDQALKRAVMYVDAGADALLIHSKSRTPDEVGAFCAAWAALHRNIPVFTVPTTYCGVTSDELRALGANGAIYANHLIRASLRAMELTLERLTADRSTRELEPDIATVQDLFDLVRTDALDNA